MERDPLEGSAGHGSPGSPIGHSRAVGQPGQPGALADGREAAMNKESCSKSLFGKV